MHHTDIKAGWGMSINPQNLTTYIAFRPCPANTYGVAAKTYGLINALCKACTKNLASAPGSDGFGDCKNPAGFGYTSEGANQCPDDFWAAADAMRPCEPCAKGRVTDYEPGNGTLQDSVFKCRVLPGYGIYNTSSSDPWNPASPSANTPVKPCPIGFFSAGDTGAPGTNTSNPTCRACPVGQSTSTEGSSTCDGEAPHIACSNGTAADHFSDCCAAVRYCREWNASLVLDTQQTASPPRSVCTWLRTSCCCTAVHPLWIQHIPAW